MRKIFVAALAASLQPAAAQFVIQPYVSDVVDAASLTPGISAGGLFIVDGYFTFLETGFDAAPLPLPERFNGVTVELRRTGGGTPFNAFIAYIDIWTRNRGYQIAAVLPSWIEPGVYDVTISAPGYSVVGIAKARVVPSKYRSFANNQEGYGLARMHSYIGSAPFDRNMFVAGWVDDLRKGPAKPGQSVVLSGVGLGPISKPDNEAPGEIDLRSNHDVRVVVGGSEAQVDYAGRAPDLPGRDQISFTLPADVQTGCNVPVEVIVDGSASNPVTIAISAADRDACEHPFLTRDQLEDLDQGKKLLAGEFNMTVYTEVAPDVRDRPWVEINSALGHFSEMTASRASTISADSIPLGRCVSWRVERPGRASWLNAYADDSADGGKVTLSGPGFADVPLDDDDDWYWGLFSVRRLSDGALLAGSDQHAFTPGEYTLRGTGGEHVGPITTALQLPELPRWSNLGDIESIDRNAPPTITWTSGGPGDRIIIQGASMVRLGGDSFRPDVDAGVFICAMPPTANSFTLPVEVLQRLPASASLPSAGYLVVSAHGPRTTFQASVTEENIRGFGTDLVGTFGHLVMVTKAVAYK